MAIPPVTLRCTSLLNPVGERTTWQYDPAGRITTLTHANATRAVHAYNAAGWVTQVVNAKSDGTTLTSHDYSYDEVGNPTSLVEAGGGRTTWTYNPVHRLRRERRTGGNNYDLTYTYDAVGNRLTKLSGGVTATYSYDAADQLTGENAGGTLSTYTYDANGNNLTQNAAGALLTMTWGYEDELLVIAKNTGTVTVTYDGDLMRRTRERAAVANYVWDGAQVLLEEDAGHVTTARYTLAPFGYGDLVSQRRSDATSWYHFDGLGSMRALTDAGAAVTDTALYQAFGTRVATTGSTTHNYRWVGKLGYAAEQWLDGYLLRRRYYQDATGRFLSRDPLDGQVGDYLYVGQRPTWAVDPTGLQRLPRNPSRPKQPKPPPYRGPIWRARYPGEVIPPGLFITPPTTPIMYDPHNPPPGIPSHNWRNPSVVEDCGAATHLCCYHLAKKRGNTPGQVHRIENICLGYWAGDPGEGGHVHLPERFFDVNPSNPGTSIGRSWNPPRHPPSNVPPFRGLR